MQPEWKPVVSSATSSFLRALERSGIGDADVVGVYLRGSVPQGTAVPHISDLDLSAYVLTDAPHSLEKHQESFALEAEVLRNVAAARKDVEEQYPFCTKVGATQSLISGTTKFDFLH